MTLSRSPQCRAFSKALMDERLLSPLFTAGVGVGVGGGEGELWGCSGYIYDWCITGFPSFNYSEDYLYCKDIVDRNSRINLFL